MTTCQSHLKYHLPEAARVDWGLERWWKHINAQVYHFYPGRIVGRVIDVGCGVGAMSLLVAQDPAVSYVLGLDVSYEAIAAAERFRERLGESKVEFQIADFTIPTTLPAESFDSAMSFHTLEHIYPEDLDQFMANLNAVLKPGATVLISIPHLRNYYDPGHKSFFDVASLRTLFVTHGFTPEEVYSTYEGRRVTSNYDGKILTGLFHKGGIK